MLPTHCVKKKKVGGGGGRYLNLWTFLNSIRITKNESYRLLLQRQAMWNNLQFWRQLREGGRHWIKAVLFLRSLYKMQTAGTKRAERSRKKRQRQGQRQKQTRTQIETDIDRDREREKERQANTERETRHTQRQRQIQTDRQTDRQTEIDRKRQTDRERETGKQRERDGGRQTEIEKETEKERQANRKRHRDRDRQTDRDRRKRDRQTESYPKHPNFSEALTACFPSILLVRMGEFRVVAAWIVYKILRHYAPCVQKMVILNVIKMCFKNTPACCMLRIRMETADFSERDAMAVVTSKCHNNKTRKPILIICFHYFKENCVLAAVI